MFITFEGGEGAGKTTQIKRLTEALHLRGITPVVTREPGGTAGGKLIRGLLLDKDNAPEWEPLTEYLLLLADRHHHMETLIKPALTAGQWVISDRFQDSSWVYQGWVKDLDSTLVDTLYQLTIHHSGPDITFILDVPAADGIDRLQRRAQETGLPLDRNDRRERAFHDRIRQGFLELANQHPQRCHVIDGSQSIETVHTHIMDILHAHL